VAAEWSFGKEERSWENFEHNFMLINREDNITITLKNIDEIFKQAVEKLNSFSYGDGDVALGGMILVNKKIGWIPIKEAFEKYPNCKIIKTLKKVLYAQAK
jgi:ribosomal protein S2